MAGADSFGDQLKSVKIIKDRDDRPKGFGYVEFETLQGLKDGLAKSGVVSAFGPSGGPSLIFCGL